MIAGVGSFAFGWAVAHAQPPFDEHALLAFARGGGIARLQIADNLPVHTWTAERLDTFVSSARRDGVTIELGARGLTDAHLSRYLELCTRVRARLLRFVADAAPYEPSPDDLIALLRNAVPALSAARVTVALENHDRFAAATLRRIVDAAASVHVGVCLDTANSLGAGEGLRAVSEVLAPVTVNLHVKDVRISRLPDMMGFLVEGCTLGDGQLPIAEAIDLVRRYGRCESVILEAWTPPAATIGGTIERELASASASVERLKQLVAPG